MVKVETTHVLTPGPSHYPEYFRLVVDPQDKAIKVCVGEDAGDYGWWMSEEEARALRRALTMALRFL